jgi:putative Mn2+ efflux pump MntP
MTFNLVAILLVALSVSIGNFFASISIGLSRIDRKTRIKVLVLFGIFEISMPVLGLLIGAELSSLLLDASRYIGAALLFLLGAYSLWRSRNKDGGSKANPMRFSNAHLVFMAFVLSMDNLAIGFSLGSYRIPIIVAAAVIAIVSVVLSAIGLEAGRRFGKHIAASEDVVMGVMLMAIGAIVALS